MGYVDDHGVHHADATDLLHQGVLGFCGCGKPAETLRYVLQGLALIDEKGPCGADPATWNAWYEGHLARQRALFGNDISAMFFAYWANAHNLTEHGGNVGASWLTADGERLLGLLRAWQARQTT